MNLKSLSIKGLVVALAFALLVGLGEAAPRAKKNPSRVKRPQSTKTLRGKQPPGRQKPQAGRKRRPSARPAQARAAKNKNRRQPNKKKSANRNQAQRKAGQAAKLNPRQVAFFEQRIRPVLVKHCYQCHSAKAKEVEGELYVDTRQGLLEGGQSGPAIVPGKPEESLLLEALKYESLEMPPEGKLPDAVIRDFERWIRMGAPDPRTGKLVRKKMDVSQGRDFWAYQPPRKHPAPSVRNTSWPTDSVDRFILARLEAAGLEPVEDADPATLIRRVSFDLTGLPPRPEDVQAFVANPTLENYTQYVDRLLASQEFAQRWAQHWLDVVRFGESTGKDVNVTYPFAWRYRNYVVEAFHQDKPFNRFIVEQIAGDLLPARNEKERERLIVATGFLALGPKTAAGPEEQRLMDIVDDQIEATFTVFMGTTVHCARCHDHKFDPIPTQDYYAIAGIFRSTEVLDGVGRLRRNQPTGRFAYVSPGADEKLKAYKEYRRKRQQLNDEITKVTRQRLAARRANPKRLKQLDERLRQLRRQLNQLELNPPPMPMMAMGVADRDNPRDIHVLLRGDIRQRGELVPRGFLSVLGASEVKIPQGQSGRLQLARWIASRQNPLTARVIVNRVWAKLFGRGLVPTVDNFGSMGQKPSHPELLDTLAVEFMDQGWSLKRLIRRLVLSHTYRLSSRFDPHAYEVDGDNVLRWRMQPRRLDAEAIRDAMLEAAGILQHAPPAEGSPVMRMGVVRLRNNLPRELKGEGTNVRSLYLPRIRNNLPEVLKVFDAADPSYIVGQRDVTTVPLQALFLMNSPEVRRIAEAFARRLEEELPGTQPEARIRRAYLLALAREPEADELQRALQFVADGESDHIWADFCQALFASAEFRYLY